MQQELADFVHTVYQSEWLTACDNVEKKYGNCFEKENDWPSGMDIYKQDFGLFITFPALYLLYDKGNGYDLDFGLQALKNTLDSVSKKFPLQKYQGYIAFLCPDDTVIQQVISSVEDEIPERFEFIAEAIGDINKNLDSYIDVLLECCYEEELDGKWVLDVFQNFHLYKEKIDISVYDRILETVCEYIEDDDIYEQLEDEIDQWKTDVAETEIP
ncbi:MAG: hypothetical protein ACI4HI_18210 [Lachnospiraceae bacterium]